MLFVDGHLHVLWKSEERLQHRHISSTEVAIYLVINYVEKTSLMTYPTDRVCQLAAIPLVVTKPWRQVNHGYVGR